MSYNTSNNWYQCIFCHFKAPMDSPLLFHTGVSVEKLCFNLGKAACRYRPFPLLPATLNIVYAKSLLILYCSQHPCEHIQWTACRKRLKRKAVRRRWLQWKLRRKSSKYEWGMQVADIARFYKKSVSTSHLQRRRRKRQRNPSLQMRLGRCIKCGKSTKFCRKALPK